MADYLKIEEDYGNQNVSLRGDLMGISMLALLMSPWAVIGLLLSVFEISFMTQGLTIACIATLLVAVPQALCLLKTNSGPEHPM